MDALSVDEETIEAGLSLADLRGVLPSDRSNRRRVLRSLVARDEAEWVMETETGEPRLRLTWLARVAATWKLAGPYPEEAVATPYKAGDPM